MTTETRCELGNLLFKPEMKIKIELLVGNGNVSWSEVRRIRLYQSKFSQDFFLGFYRKTKKINETN